ncbi:hypothetical protein K470DRAFT_84048 [Piedraia hortae CBS 480.64]|uniref:Uncharacterized protein n=1 Tax=Piedraia hortae CBS 480.64 TaxID=1314780 RepID=A0A6A7C8W3_9PEZI|nr:hypothetical protein K470DRAFT_84048 [Piedraia hortae CBS 480.64]
MQKKRKCGPISNKRHRLMPFPCAMLETRTLQTGLKNTYHMRNYVSQDYRVESR